MYFMGCSFVNEPRGRVCAGWGEARCSGMVPGTWDGVNGVQSEHVEGDASDLIAWTSRWRWRVRASPGLCPRRLPEVRLRHRAATSLPREHRDSLRQTQ